VQAKIDTIIEQFPDFQVAVLIANNLSAPETVPPELAEEIAAIEAEALALHADKGMGEIPGVAVWRNAYKAFGVRKTSYRCSVERLIRKVRRDGKMAQIHPFVDAYNAVSLKHVFPLGADDLDKTVGDVCFREAREGDTFFALGQQPPRNDPPKTGEIIYADDKKVLCRRWNWYQDIRSPVTTEAKRAIVTIQSLGAGDLNAAVDDLERLLRTYFGAEVAHVTLNVANPVADLPT
jgi:DNA/RNA-binding domain of Phe-tRNA-synthetase-like protein